MASLNPLKVAREALERSEAERTAYLDQVCGDDQALRHAVEVLLDEDRDDDGFLEPPIEGAADHIATEWLKRGQSTSDN